MTLVYITIALIGLSVGSFLNVVIYRVPISESLVAPGSHCPHCEATIRPWHNVPVLGWLVLRGRCHDCKVGISPRYPLVEAMTAALFVAMTAHFGLSAQLPAYLYLSSIAIALSLIDLDVRRLPNVIVIPSYLVGLVLLIPPAIAGDMYSIGRALLAMLALFGAYFALSAAYPGGMGFGDVKLAGLLGLFLGFVSWSSVLVATFAAFLIGGTAGILLLLTRQASRKSAVPFGPFMLLGAILAIFFASPIASWYTALLGSTSMHVN
jgi:leader peptidase (prepilin peptidase)/N-methyltransferase